MAGLDVFNIIAGVCGILSFLISIFVASKVIKIENNFNVNSDISNTSNDLDNVSIGGSYTGRDSK